ncbi:MAG: hypothetical protein RPR97_02995 [Colwellia sp.]
MSTNTNAIVQDIRSKNFASAEKQLAEFIESQMLSGSGLSVISTDIFSTQKVDIEQERYNFCDRMASLISELFCQKDYIPSKRIIDNFLTYKVIIEWIFTGSVWKNTDALINKLGLLETNNQGQVNFSERQLTLLLMLTSLSTKYPLPWGQLMASMPERTLSSYVGLITQPIPALSKENNEGFNHLLESAKDFPIFNLPVLNDLAKFNYPFFACSYATSPNKYEFKKWLTKTLRHNLPQWLSNEVKNDIKQIQPLKTKKKMKIAVMLELYADGHAMHRCYNTIFKSLSDKFELIAYIDEADIKYSTLDLFDKIVPLKNILDINENAQLVIQETPDIVYYPSIGMKFWGIYLSQLRLAPLQVMSPGHPSSSFSSEIDYLLLLEDTIDPKSLQAFYSEKVVTGNIPTSDAKFHTMRSDLTPEFLAKHNTLLMNDKQIKIGINGVLTKVNHTIIDVCQRIEKQTNKKVVFVFFSANESSHLAYLSPKKQLSRALKHIQLDSFNDYVSYMKTISECDFLLPTLPFGGSNSNIDAMLLNKPKLFINGTEQVYTRTDQREWERVGLEQELGCDSIKQLVEKSLRLIDDATYREELHQLIADKCTLDNLFGEPDSNKDLITDLLFQVIDEHIDKQLPIDV